MLKMCHFIYQLLTIFLYINDALCKPIVINNCKQFLVYLHRPNKDLNNNKVLAIKINIIS